MKDEKKERSLKTFAHGVSGREECATTDLVLFKRRANVMSCRGWERMRGERTKSGRFFMAPDKKIGYVIGSDSCRIASASKPIRFLTKYEALLIRKCAEHM